MSAVSTTAKAKEKPKPRKKRSDRARAENRLGQKLVAPAVIVMLAVTAWPMFQALYLSTFRYRLTSPDDKEFVGLSNYGTVLTDPLFWQDTVNTVLIMVVTVGVELVIGFAFAMVMHRIVFARGTVRTAILIPYGIITVVSATGFNDSDTIQAIGIRHHSRIRPAPTTIPIFVLRFITPPLGPRPGRPGRASRGRRRSAARRGTAAPTAPSRVRAGTG